MSERQARGRAGQKGEESRAEGKVGGVQGGGEAMPGLRLVAPAAWESHGGWSPRPQTRWSRRRRRPSVRRCGRALVPGSCG